MYERIEYELKETYQAIYSSCEIPIVPYLLKIAELGNEPT
jgi:hypothetical protein